MKRWIASILAAGLLTAGLGVAQQKGRVNQRQENQKDRIKEGVKEGSLTPAEAARLRERERVIAAKEARDRADGKGFTAKEKAAAERRQDKASKAIYEQKHDAQTK